MPLSLLFCSACPHSFGPRNTVGATFWYSDRWGGTYWVDCPVFAAASDGSWAACETLPPSGYCLDATCSPLAPVVGTFVVNVNNVTAPCTNRTGSNVSSCAFTFDPASTPQVSSFSVSGDRRTATLTGRRLQNASDPASAAIYVGGAPCGSVTQVGPTVITCTLPVGTSIAGVSASVSGYTYLGTINATGVTYTPPLILTGISVTNGSAAGGMVVFVTGSGFSVANSSENRVFVGPASTGPRVNSSAYVVNVSTTQFGATLAVVMPPAPVGSFRGNISRVTVDITVWVQTTGSTVVARATLSAAFTYTAALTPAILAATPLTGASGTVLTISGRGFSGLSGTALPTVTVGGSPCTVDELSSNATVVVCTLASPPAGSHPIFVNVPSSGLASQASGGQSTFTSALVVSSLSRITYGLGGGAPLTLFGTGFVVAPSSAMGGPTFGTQSVTICNAPCSITAATPTSLTCTMGPLITQAAITTNNVWQPTVLTPVASALTPLIAPAFDGDVGTGTQACTATIDLGLTTRGIVTEVAFFPTLGRDGNLASANFAGSNDASVWTVLATAPAVPHAGWNSLAVQDDSALGFNATQAPAYRYLRMSLAAGLTSCGFQELTWLGYAVAATSTSGNCPIYVSITGPSEPRAVLAGITPALATSSPPTVTVQLSQSVQYSLDG